MRVGALAMVAGLALGLAAGLPAQDEAPGRARRAAARPDEGYVTALTRTLLKYGDAHIPERSILWLSRTFEQPVPQVIDDLGRELEDYAGGGAEGDASAKEKAKKEAAEEAAARRRRARAAASDDAEEPSSRADAEPERPVLTPQARAERHEEKYLEALDRILKKYAGVALPEDSLEWAARTFERHPRELLEDLGYRAFRRQLSPPSGGGAPVWSGQGYDFSAGGQEARWNYQYRPGRGYVTPPRQVVERRRAKRTLKRKKRERAARREEETKKDRPHPGYGSVQFFHWGGIKEPVSFTVKDGAGKVKTVRSIPYPGGKPRGGMKCVSHHPHAATVQVGPVHHAQGTTIHTSRRTIQVRKGQCVALGIGAYDPGWNQAQFQSGLDSAAGVGLNSVVPAPPSRPSPNLNPGIAGGGMVRIQRISQEMMAAASRGDVARQQELLAEMLRLADDHRDVHRRAAEALVAPVHDRPLRSRVEQDHDGFDGQLPRAIVGVVRGIGFGFVRAAIRGIGIDRFDRCRRVR